MNPLEWGQPKLDRHLQGRLQGRIVDLAAHPTEPQVTHALVVGLARIGLLSATGPGEVIRYQIVGPPIGAIETTLHGVSRDDDAGCQVRHSGGGIVNLSRGACHRKHGQNVLFEVGPVDTAPCQVAELFRRRLETCINGVDRFSHGVQVRQDLFGMLQAKHLGRVFLVFLVGRVVGGHTEGIPANHPNGGEAYLNRPTSIMGVGKQEELPNLIPHGDFHCLAIEFSQHPNDPPVLQTSSRVVGYFLILYERVKPVESLVVLDDFVPRADDPQLLGCAVVGSAIHVHLSLFGADSNVVVAILEEGGTLEDFPIQASVKHGFFAGQVRVSRQGIAKAVPRGFANKHHRIGGAEFMRHS